MRTRAERIAAKATDNAWERVCRELGATKAEVTSALSLMRAGRCFAEVTDPAICSAVETLCVFAGRLDAYNSPHTMHGGGGPTGKPEGKDPGFRRCPDAVEEFVDLAASVRHIAEHARIERKESDGTHLMGGVDTTPPERDNSGRFAGGRQGPRGLEEKAASIGQDAG